MKITTDTFYDPLQKIWSGPKSPSVFESQSTLGGEILKVLKKDLSKVLQFMDSNGTETTADNLLHDSQKIAGEFLKLGVKAGDVIGIYANNTGNLTSVIIAALLCGTPWNSLYPELDKDGIKKIFQITEPKIICCDLENYEILKAALREMNLKATVFTINGKILNVASIVETLESSDHNPSVKSFPGLELEGNATAAILCSSGTTGHPKGVLVSHSTLLNSNPLRNVDAESVLFSFSTLFWISGVWNLTTSLLNGAKRIVTNLPSTPENLLNLIQKYSVTHVIASTSLTTKLVQEAKRGKEARLNSIHCFAYGGSKVFPTIAESFYNLFNSNKTKPGPIVCYGMTELGGMLCETYTGSTDRRFDNEGKLMPNLKVRIVDRNTGSLLGPNETGVILVRSPYQWAGYYRNSEATQKVYKDGWINTGDIGYFDDEGFFFISARECDIFKSNGFQIYPNKLEDLILQMPGVADACIFGVPDLVATNFIACAVVRKNDVEGAALKAEDIESKVKKNVAKEYQISGGVYFLDKLPKTSSEKLLRRQVYDLIMAKTP